MKGIFALVCLVSILFQRLVSSAPVKQATPKPTKSPADIHCGLHYNIRELINYLPYAMGQLEESVYKRYQLLVSVDEKKYLHNHLHLTKLWSPPPQPNNQLQLVAGPALQLNQTVTSVLRNSSLALSCSICSLRESKQQYRRFPNSSKVIKAVDDIKNNVKDLLSEIQKVGKAIKPGSVYKTCLGSTCQINLTKVNRSRKQIALDLAYALENLHAKLSIMKVNFFELKKASCAAPTVNAVGLSSG